MDLDGNIISKSVLNEAANGINEFVETPQSCLNTKSHLNYSVTMISYSIMLFALSEKWG